MHDHSHHDHKQRLSMDDYLPTTTRLEAFSDAVIAIIMTILILGIQIPQAGGGAGATDAMTNSQAFSLLASLGPNFFAFILSFLALAIYWVNHHFFFANVEFTDKWLLWYNNHLLFWLAIIPFATQFLGQHPTLPVAIAVYGFVMAMGAFAFTLMGHYVFFESKLISDDISQPLREREFNRSRFGTFVYALTIPLAFFLPYVSWAVFLLLPAYFFFPRRLGGM